jgi:hypothetical protein
MSPSNFGSKESTTARLLGSGTSGVLELLGFHPVDTVAKRLMNNKERIFGQGWSHARTTLNTVIFKDAANMSTARKYISLFPGLGVAAGYKVLQRMYKFAGQLYVKDYLQKNHTDTFASLVGRENAKTMMSATAGSLIGIGEVILLPLDALKIKMQVASQQSKKGVVGIIKEEGLGLYRGAGWTMARNAPGSFALFGGSAATKQYIFGLGDQEKPTLFQDTICSIVGAVTSITVSAPV